ncbi:MAG: hypothetical protein AMS16_00905 [Planctomycetes bacterium DG_58]|nr:MAG: hypothetical protein AMS16_00905 [Planctomycetes bacterium DG_58]
MAVVPGHVVTVPAEMRTTVDATLRAWAHRCGYAGLSREPERIVFGKGKLGKVGIYLQATFAEVDGQLEVELAVYQKMFGCVAAVKRPWWGFPRYAMKDREALLLALESALPEAEVREASCQLRGMPHWLFTLVMFILMTAIIATGHYLLYWRCYVTKGSDPFVTFPPERRCRG